MTTSTHVSAGCICGAILDDDLGKLETALVLEREFRQVHTGPGHAPTDVAHALRLGRAMRKALAS